MSAAVKILAAVSVAMAAETDSGIDEPPQPTAIAEVAAPSPNMVAEVMKERRLNPLGFMRFSISAFVFMLSPCAFRRETRLRYESRKTAAVHFTYAGRGSSDCLRCGFHIKMRSTRW